MAFPMFRSLTHAQSKAAKAHRTAGFTLIELLMVIAIIAILSALALVAIAGAQNDARRSATINRISQIHSMLQQRMEDYEFRRVPLTLKDYVSSGDELAKARQLHRRILADIINAEMPRTVADVALMPAVAGNVSDSTYPGPELVEWIQDDLNDPDGILMKNRPAGETLLEDLVERIPATVSQIASRVGSPPPDATVSVPTSGEYLYFILQTTDIDGSPMLDFFSANAFGDTDQDGYLEVLDSWGNPLIFSFQMLDDEGNLVSETGSEIFGKHFDHLNPGFSDTNINAQAAFGTSVHNIRIQIISTGNGGELISNLPVNQVDNRVLQSLGLVP